MSDGSSDGMGPDGRSSGESSHKENQLYFLYLSFSLVLR